MDWSSLTSKYIDPATSKSKMVVSLDRSAEVAWKSVAAIGAGVAMIPAFPFPIVGGLLAIVAKIIELSTLPGLKPQLDLPSITAAVQEVVRTEINKQSADLAATQFVNVTNWLTDTANVGILGPYSLKIFKKSLAHYLMADSNFMNMLTHMARNPDEAQYILPIYALGISSYVQMLWLELAVSVVEGDTRSKAMYGVCRSRIAAQRDGLSLALQATRKYVDAKMTELNGRNMGPQSDALADAIWKNTWGISGPDMIASHLAELDTIVGQIDHDIATFDTSGYGFLWKGGWSPVPV